MKAKNTTHTKKAVMEAANDSASMEALSEVTRILSDSGEGETLEGAISILSDLCCSESIQPESLRGVRTLLEQVEKGMDRAHSILWDHFKLRIPYQVKGEDRTLTIDRLLPGSFCISQDEIGAESMLNIRKVTTFEDPNTDKTWWVYRLLNVDGGPN